MISAEQFAKLSPYARGYAAYWYGSRDDEPNVPDEECPYPEGSDDASEWHKGQQRATLDAQDSEE